MASPIYMTIQGAQQNDITSLASHRDSIGEAGEKSHENEVMVLSYEHKITLPRDNITGSASDKCTHGHVEVIKLLDRTSPLLMQALTTGELLTNVTLRWYRTFEGKQQHYFTIVLENAKVVSKQDYMHNRQDPDLAHYTHQEKVCFSYGKIIQTHEAAKSLASADWRETAPADA